MKIKNVDTFGSRLLRHADLVSSVRWSPDGKFLASASYDGTVVLWNAENGERLKTFSGHVGHVTGVSFDSAADAIVSCGHDGTLRRWSMTDTVVPFVLAVSPAPLNSLVVCGQHAFLAGAEGIIYCVDLDSAKIDPILRYHQAGDQWYGLSLDERFKLQENKDSVFEIREVDAPDTICGKVGENAVMEGDPGALSVVYFENHQMLFRAWPSVVHGLALSPEEDVLFSCGQDGGVRAWNLFEQGSDTWFGKKGGVVHDVHASINRNQLITAGHDGIVRIYEGEKEVAAIRVSSDPLLCVSDAKGVLYCAGQDSNIYQVLPEKLNRLTGHFWPVTSIDWNLNRQLLVSASKDYTIRIWELSQQQEVTPHIDAPIDYIDAVSWVEENSVDVVLAGSEDGTVRRWTQDAESLLLTKLKGQVQAMVLVKKENAVLVADHLGNSILLDLKSLIFNRLSFGDSREDGICALAVNENQNPPIAFGIRRSGEVCCIQLANGKENRWTTIGDINISIATATIHAGTATLAVGSRTGEVRRFKLSPRGIQANGCDNLHNNDWVTALAFSADGSMLLSGGWDRLVWLRRKTQSPLKLVGHLDTVRVAGFDDTGTYCYTGSWDGMLYAWKTEDGSLVNWAENEGRGVSMAITKSRFGDTLMAIGNANTTVTTFLLTGSNIGGKR